MGDGVVSGRPHQREAVGVFPAQHPFRQSDGAADGEESRLEAAGGGGRVGVEAGVLAAFRSGDEVVVFAVVQSGDGLPVGGPEVDGDAAALQAVGGQTPAYRRQAVRAFRVRNPAQMLGKQGMSDKGGGHVI